MIQEKILFMITKSAWGGAQRYVFDLATHLPSESYTPLVMTGGEGPFVEKLRTAGIRTVQVKGLDRNVSVIRDLFAVWRLVRIMRNERPDIIHLNSSKIGGLGAVAAWLYNTFRAPRSALRAKVVFTAHGWAWDEERPAWQKRAIIFLTKVAARFQDAIIVLSRHDMDSALRHGIPGKKLFAIPLGIPEPVHFLSPMDAYKKLTDAVGLPFQRPLFGTIAELTKNKGLPYLIQALIIFKQSVPRFTCLMIGEGEQRETFAQMIRKNALDRHVHIVGFLPHASEYLKAFDFFVLPSIKEGLPYVLLEATKAEIPIVSTRIGGVPDIVEHGENGLLVEARNPHALARALADLARSPEMQTRFSKAASKKIQAFSFEKMLADTIRCYQRIHETFVIQS